MRGGVDFPCVIGEDGEENPTDQNLLVGAAPSYSAVEQLLRAAGAPPPTVVVAAAAAAPEGEPATGES
eukprot:SAG22_NODE_713_length_7726_cov_10.328701_4_plen_68_part_00